jgi:glycosyltransferase involved in cell wall biosynthesis
MAYRHPDSRVIHNPVDTQQFAPAGEAAAEEFTGRPLRGVALRGLGRIYGLDIAIRAYTERPETDLTIIGTGPLAAELRSLIAATGSHTTLVAQSLPHAEIPGLLRSFDYFVAPSRNETQGVAMCEAMACGLPVVATHVGGIPEFVRDGMDGYLVPPENPAALHAAIKRLVADPARLRAMGRDARQHMQDVCSGAVIARQELALLAEAAV